jgi:hypothetical protein
LSRYRNYKIHIIKSASENEKEIEFLFPLWNVGVYDFEWKVTELQGRNVKIVRRSKFKWNINSTVVIKRGRIHKRRAEAEFLIILRLVTGIKISLYLIVLLDHCEETYRIF